MLSCLYVILCPLISSTVPNCVSYDPTFSYEVAVIIQNGLQRMYVDDEDVYFYLTLLNENYQHPEMPKGVEKDILKGMYPFSQTKGKIKAQLLGSGSILREAIAAAQLLKELELVPSTNQAIQRIKGGAVFILIDAEKTKIADRGEWIHIVDDMIVRAGKKDWAKVKLAD